MTKKGKKNQQVVVFDFDGTLVNSMEAFADIAARIMPRHHPIDSKTARKSYLKTSGIPFFQQLEQLFPGNPANKEASEEFEKTKLEGYFDEPLFEDAADTVEHLRKRGIRVAVSSNNFQHLVEKYVDKANVEFDMVLGFKENFAKGKDHFDHIERVLGVDRKDIIFIGDSIKDGERARDCGVSFIAKAGIFNRSQFKKKFPDAKVIKTLSELKSIIRLETRDSRRETACKQ